MRAGAELDGLLARAISGPGAPVGTAADLGDGAGRRSGRARRKQSVAEAGDHRSLPFPVLVFAISLVVPWLIMVGPLALSLPRMVLLATFVPCFVNWISGKAGRIRIADVALLSFCLWCALSLIVVEGIGASIQPAGILLVETMGPYLLARTCIRDLDDFRNMVRLFFRVVLFLLPFALFEAVTGRDILLQFYTAILPSYPDAGDEVRAGLTRAQVVFEHPILFGICAGSVFALVHLVLGYGQSLFQRWWKTGLVGLTAFLSLSSAPMAAVVLQAFLLGWGWALRNNPFRWKLLLGLALAGCLVIAVGSNQTLVQFYISHFTFDRQTGWYRIAIWTYASASVVAHPLFGIGFADWARPKWMYSSTIDMFWVVNPLRYGMPAGFLIMTAFFSGYFAISAKKGLDERHAACRTAFLIVLTAFFMVGWTVHFWGAAYAWFLFVVGSGMWLLDVEAADGREDPAAKGRRPGRPGRRDRPTKIAVGRQQNGRPRPCRTDPAAT